MVLSNTMIPPSARWASGPGEARLAGTAVDDDERERAADDVDVPHVTVEVELAVALLRRSDRWSVARIGLDDVDGCVRPGGQLLLDQTAEAGVMLDRAHLGHPLGEPDRARPGTPLERPDVGSRRQPRLDVVDRPVRPPRHVELRDADRVVGPGQAERPMSEPASTRPAGRPESRHVRARLPSPGRRRRTSCFSVPSALATRRLPHLRSTATRSCQRGRTW